MSAGVTALMCVHALAACFMCGIIWFVQVVHYPLMVLVGAEGYTRYQLAHQRLTSLVVGPAMLLEAASGVGLLLIAGVPHAPPRLESIVGVVLLVLVWASTFGVQVPLHERLSRGFDARVHRRLVASNWLRTVLWSARALLSLAMLAGGFGSG